jgi:cysteinyl-tRNA synthetase
MEYQKPDMKEEISKVEIDISNLIDLRNKARAEKKWEFSDNIRDILAKNNIIIKDTTEGTTWKKS